MRRRIAKSAVGSQQANPLLPRMVQRRFQKGRNVVTARRVPRPQPAVGNQPQIRDEGHQRVVRQTSPASRVVALGRSRLRPIARHHGRVQVERQAIDLNLIKQTAIQPIKYLRVGGLIEFVEKPDQRFEVGHARKTEESLQDRVMPYQFGMLETIAAAPDVEQELRDQLNR